MSNIITTELYAGFVRSNKGATPMIEYNGKLVPGGHFYGYRTPQDGPGDNAFKLVESAAQEYHIPVVIVLDIGETLGSQFCEDCNDGTDYEGNRYLTQWYNKIKNEYNMLLCYFRGSDTYPVACKDAWEFAKKMEQTHQKV